MGQTREWNNKFTPNIADFSNLFSIWEQNNTGANKILCNDQDGVAEALKKFIQSYNGIYFIFLKKTLKRFQCGDIIGLWKCETFPK